MPQQTRINSIDLLRGIVMIIMALDHTRDFMHSQANVDDPLNLATTTPLLYFTRWITNLCAPTFVFLSGTSAYFQSLRKSKKELSWFLFTRGLWLIVLELVIVTFGITFDVYYSILVFQTIWSIGISMIILSVAIRLPFAAIFTLGLVIVAGHNLLNIYEAGSNGQFPVWYRLLHAPGMEPVGSVNLLILYPFLPWAGLMMLGYCFGRYYLSDIMNRNKRTLILGAGLLLFFAILRFTNTYGDPSTWTTQRSGLYTFFSFINVQKYPPSLLFLSVTIGCALIILGLIGNVRNKFADAISVYGKVPLFYYVIHFYLIHLVSMSFYLMRGHTIEEGMNESPGMPLRFVAAGEGIGLGGVYLTWIAIVLVLYPLCKWYCDYKMNNKKWWLSYL